MAYNTKIQLNLYKYQNGSFKRIAVIDDYNEISFSRKFYEAGEFTITINQNIPNAKLFEMGMFVQFGNDKYDVGEIKSINTPIGSEGKGSQNLSISGFDLRYIFKRRVIKNLNSNGNWEMTAKGELVMRNLIADQCGQNAEEKRKLPVTNIIPSSAQAIGKQFTISESFSNLYDVLVTIATQSETGWRIKFENGTMTLECYTGNDLSSQVFFSTEFDSLQDGNFSESTDAFANSIYIGGKGQGDQRDIYEGEDGTPSGLNRFEAWDDQSSLTDESEYANEALSMLTQYGEITTVQGTALAKNPYVYKENYDVGDVIKISFSGKTARTKILSVTEHWTGRGQYAIEFEFGKPINNLANQLQLMLRQIQKASDKSSSTNSVRWYTIPTDSEMPKADVTYTHIGFIGNTGSGSTFKLYYDENGTGCKTYHVYFKQLDGTGKLTLTTGVEGAENLVLDSGTYVVIIYVDENGNVRNQGMTPTSTISAGNIAPVESGAVASALQDIDSEIDTNYNTLNNKINGGNFLCEGLKKSHEFTKTISSNNTWVNLVTLNDVPEHKVFLFNVTLDDRNIWWDENLTFVIMFYNYGTNSTLASPIYFNQAGHSPNGQTVQLRFLRTVAGGSYHYGKIQINLTDGNNVKAIVRAYALTDTIPEYHG